MTDRHAVQELPVPTDRPVEPATAAGDPRPRHRRRSAEYERILVPVTGSAASERAVLTAALLASEHTAVVTLVHVIEVPRELPLDALFPDEEQQAKDVLHRACSILDRYGVHHKTHSMRATTAAAAILEAAHETNAQLLVLGAEGRTRGRRTVFGRYVETVLKNATCRVMLLSAPRKGVTQQGSTVDRTRKPAASA